MNAAQSEIFELLQNAQFLTGPLGRGFEALDIISARMAALAGDGGFDAETQTMLTDMAGTLSKWDVSNPEIRAQYDMQVIRLRSKFALLSGQ
jgi:hypothetical protein